MNNRRLTRVSNGRQLVIAMGAALTLMIPSITAITADADEATGTEVSFSMYAPSVEDVTSIGDVTYVTFDNGQSVELNAQDFAAWTDTQQAIAYYNGHIQVGGGPITQGYDEKVGLCGKSWVQIEAKEWGSRWQSFWGVETWFGFSDASTSVRYDDQWGTSHQYGAGGANRKRTWNYAGASGGPGVVIMTMEPWSWAMDNVQGFCYSYSPSTTTYVW